MPHFLTSKETHRAVVPEPDKVEDEEVSLLLQQVAVEELGPAGDWTLALQGHALGHSQCLLEEELGVEGRLGDGHGAVEDAALVQLGRGVTVSTGSLCSAVLTCW